MSRCLEELQLLKHTLLPDEILTFLLPPDDSAIWQRALEDPSASDTIDRSDLCSDVSFSVRLSGSKKLWFQILLSHAYPDVPPEIHVKGEMLGREDQARWQDIIREKMLEVEGSEGEYVCVYQGFHVLLVSP
ncbi:hypothetical protein OF83DRAFT_534839 [Amylostereum chailletii]|nr:hypothetical protein OF83DRAFT_534839 [Amylostereum chailletii]